MVLFMEDTYFLFGKRDTSDFGIAPGKKWRRGFRTLSVIRVLELHDAHPPPE